jgi:hypothetical protein
MKFAPVSMKCAPISVTFAARSDNWRSNLMKWRANPADASGVAGINESNNRTERTHIMAGFLPTKDAALLAFSLNLSTRISASPTTYGLTAAIATNYQTLHDSFADALAACDPDERNKILVAAKNTARANLKTQARYINDLVQGTASVTDAQKLELGLTVRQQPSPIPPPASQPGITILATIGNTVKLRLSDLTDSANRGKPAGVDGASVFSFVGATAPTEEAEWKFEGVTSRTKIDVTFPESITPGAKVWFTAFWFNQRKQNGPAATPVGCNIPGGAAMAA